MRHKLFHAKLTVSITGRNHIDLGITDYSCIFAVIKTSLIVLYERFYHI
jgi:hypothetical protein